MMANIVNGRLDNYYDDWVLRGKPRELLTPTVALAIFPTPALTPEKYILEPEALIVAQDHRPIIEYWKDAVSLPFSERAAVFEQTYFRELVAGGEQLLLESMDIFSTNLTPSAMVLFGTTGESKVESAYLIAPRFIPPSAIYNHMKAQANIYLHAS